jgi:hypothetical protein
VTTRAPEFDYEPSNDSDDDVGEELPSIRVMSNKNKGKAKAKAKPKSKEVVPKEEVKRERKPPISTGEEREPPCRCCVQAKKTCYNQMMGKSCLNCASLKLRCENPVVRAEKKTTRNTNMPERPRDMGTWPRGISPLPTSRSLRPRHETGALQFSHVAGDNENLADDDRKSKAFIYYLQFILCLH